MQPLISGFAQIAIASADPHTLAVYYRDVVGLPFLFEAGGMHFLQAGPSRLMIYGADAQHSVKGGAIVYLEASDWSAAEAKLEANGAAFAHGAQVVMKEPGRELALRPFTDPEGHKLALMGWRPAA